MRTVTFPSKTTTHSHKLGPAVQV